MQATSKIFRYMNIPCITLIQMTGLVFPLMETRVMTIQEIVQSLVADLFRRKIINHTKLISDVCLTNCGLMWLMWLNKNMYQFDFHHDVVHKITVHGANISALLEF